MNFCDTNIYFYPANRQQPEEPNDESYEVSINENGTMPLVLLLGLSGLAVLSVLMIFVVG